MTRRGRRAAGAIGSVVLIAALGAACSSDGGGGTPVGPTAVAQLQADLLTGPYQVSLIGYDFSDVPGAPPCERSSAGTLTKWVALRAELARQGDAWVLSGVSDGGESFRIRFTTAPDPSGLPVAKAVGRADGVARDTGRAYLPAADVTVISDGAEFEARVSRNTLDGSLRGPIRFTNSAGLVNTCTFATVLISPPVSLP